MNLVWLDEYERTARGAPGLLAVASPVALAVAAGAQQSPYISWLGGFLVAIGLPILLANHVGNRGRAAEERLNADWGGSPTTILLRVDSGTPPDAVRRQRRGDVSRIYGSDLPDGRTPRAKADEIFRAATLRLRSKATDHVKYPRVFSQNKTYGFERNTYGVRWEGRILGMVSVAASVALLLATTAKDVQVSAVAVLVAALASLAFTLFWFFWPTPARVREAGDRYAERLLDAAGEM